MTHKLDVGQSFSRGFKSSSPQQAAGYELRFSKLPVSNRPTPQAAGNATRRDSNHMLQDDVLARLLSFPNVIVTSHQAFFTREALNEIADTTLGNVKAWFDGSPRYQV